MIQYFAVPFILYMWISTCIGVYSYIGHDKVDIWDLLAPIVFGFFIYLALVLLPIVLSMTK